MWAAGIILAAISTIGTKISIQSNGVCRISLSRGFMVLAASLRDRHQSDLMREVATVEWSQE